MFIQAQNIYRRLQMPKNIVVVYGDTWIFPIGIKKLITIGLRDYKLSIHELLLLDGVTL